MTKEDINKVCPLAFASAPTNPKVSEKYLHVNTETIIDDLAKLTGFQLQLLREKLVRKEQILSSLSI